MQNTYVFFNNMKSVSPVSSGTYHNISIRLSILMGYLELQSYVIHQYSFLWNISLQVIHSEINNTKEDTKHKSLSTQFIKTYIRLIDMFYLSCNCWVFSVLLLFSHWSVLICASCLETSLFAICSKEKSQTIMNKNGKRKSNVAMACN